MPEDVGTWTLQQGIDLGDIEKKAADSLKNKVEVHERLKKRREIFKDVESQKIKFIILLALLTVLIILNTLRVVGLIRMIFIVKIIVVFGTLLLFVFLVIRMSTFLWKNKDIAKEFEEIDRMNGIGTQGKASPDSLEIVAQTFVPGLKTFMEAYGNHSTQEQIKEMLRSAMASYDIYSEKIGISLRRSRKIMYTEVASLEYLIDNLKKDAGIEEDLVYLAYYDYIKNPSVKEKLNSILTTKKLEKSREKLIQLFKTSIRWDTYFHWRPDSVDKIILETLEQYVSNEKNYTLRSVKAELSDLVKNMDLYFNLFINNLDIFGVRVDLEQLKMYDDNDLTLESLKDGTFFIRTLLSKGTIGNKNLSNINLNLIYHYGDSESCRRNLLSKLGKEDKEIFANFIYKDVLRNKNSISKETLGRVLSSIGDYRIEKLGNKFNKILELLEFLNIAEKAMNAIDFKASTNVNSDEYVKGITMRIISETEDGWKRYYQEYFTELVDWNEALHTMFPESDRYSINQYVTILFILFCNGLMRFQPVVDKISLNQFYLSVEPGIETNLLKFVELSQKVNTIDIPKIIMDILENPVGDDHPYFVSMFRKEFALGSIPSYDFLVFKASGVYLKQYNDIPLKNIAKNEDKMLKKIVDTIFLLELNEDFIKSMLIGGAVNAYLIFKPSKDGNLITMLKSGSQLASSQDHLRSFSSFLRYNWTKLDVTKVPDNVGSNDFYRVGDAGYAVILGIVPENMIFKDFSNTMDKFIETYLNELINEAHSFNPSDSKVKNTLGKLGNIKGWEILPLDISTIRKAFDSTGAHSTERGYIVTIKKLFREESTRKKLAWIGMIESKGNVSEDKNLRSIIRDIAKHDNMGFVRYLEFYQSDFEVIEGISGPDLNTILSREKKEILNLEILKLIGTKSFLEACDLINSGTVKDDFIKSKLEKFRKKIDDVELKLSTDGVNSIADQINLIARVFDLLIGPKKQV